MSHISELVGEARSGVSHWPRCTAEQALVYSCESVASREHPGRHLDPDTTRALVAQICLAEDIDVPVVDFTVAPGSAGWVSRCIAWADRGGHALSFIGPDTDVHTVVHEVAHLLSHSDAHDAHFRDLLVRLARAHVGIEYAALLHSLFAGAGLHGSPWTSPTRTTFGQPR